MACGSRRVLSLVLRPPGACGWWEGWPTRPAPIEQPPNLARWFGGCSRSDTVRSSADLGNLAGRAGVELDMTGKRVKLLLRLRIMQVVIGIIGATITAAGAVISFNSVFGGHKNPNMNPQGTPTPKISRAPQLASPTDGGTVGRCVPAEVINGDVPPGRSPVIFVFATKQEMHYLTRVVPPTSNPYERVPLRPLTIGEIGSDKSDYIISLATVPTGLAEQVKNDPSRSYKYTPEQYRDLGVDVIKSVTVKRRTSNAHPC